MGGSGSGWGVRVDVNEKIYGGGGGGVDGGVRVDVTKN